MLCAHRKTKQTTKFYAVDLRVETFAELICVIVLEEKGVDGWSETHGIRVSDIHPLLTPWITIPRLVSILMDYFLPSAQYQVWFLRLAYILHKISPTYGDDTPKIQTTLINDVDIFIPTNCDLSPFFTWLPYF